MSTSEASLFQLSLDECRRRLKQPSKSLDVVRPCTPNDGIEQWSPEDLEELVAGCQAHPPRPNECGLWVPASGAASRMFSFLFSDESSQERLWKEADRLAFGEAWTQAVQKAAQGTGGEVTPKLAAQVLLEWMRNGNIPKGMVPFHRIEVDGKSQVESAFEAHLRLWSKVVGREGGVAWFSVQSAHRPEIQAHLEGFCKASRLQLHLPEQDSNTNTPILDSKGGWMRDEAGNLLTRPGGHGSLLPLFEDISTSMVVVRNIDNAPSPQRFDLRLMWTQAMIEGARRWEEERAAWLSELHHATAPSKNLLEWLKNSGAGIDDALDEISKRDCLDLLNRPMRLVGVVKNQGLPGGGPYWCKVSQGIDRGRIKPQIVESIEMNEATLGMLNQATHFNPVDMVCILNPEASLSEFVDHTRYLTAIKTVGGEEVRILEHPGLWNGGMSGWLTRFVEMPSACFQPVKSALDLISRE